MTDAVPVSVSVPVSVTVEVGPVPVSVIAWPVSDPPEAMPAAEVTASVGALAVPSRVTTPGAVTVRLLVATSDPAAVSATVALVPVLPVSVMSVARPIRAR